MITPRCSRIGAVLYPAISLLIILLDQWSKRAVVNNIPLGGAVDVIPWLFRLCYTRNTGAAWSMLTGRTGLLAVFSAVAALGIGLYMLCARLCPLARLSLSFVLGGAIGNLIDRAVLGYVIDMIEVTFVEFPVFNVADSFIVVGGIAFAAIFLFWNDRYLIAHGLLAPPEKTEK